MRDPEPEEERPEPRGTLRPTSAGALTVWARDSVPSGVLVFLVCVAVLGPALWLYERRRRQGGAC